MTRITKMSRQLLRASMCFGFAVLIFVASGTYSSCFAGIINTPAPVLLSTLVGNPQATYTVGDKVFSGFSYLSTGDMPAAGGVNVAALVDNQGNFGIEFQGAFVDLPSSQGGSD